MRKVDCDDRQFAVYAYGRAISPAMLQTWMKVFAGHAPGRRPLAVLDLGSGTGRFTPALARAFGGPVYGVEPSRRMRQIAARSSAHAAVRYLAGYAEAIPLLAGSCDLVLMYLVFHHVHDRAAGAAEVARVLRPGRAREVDGCGVAGRGAAAGTVRPHPIRALASNTPSATNRAD